jgi:diguanylate cyclase (GGDEF)-like protein/PAS domain S-box-containing protein
MSDIYKDTIRNGMPISVLDTIKVLDATPFPIAVVDLQDNNIHFWSRSANTLFGHTAPTATEWYEIAYPDPDYRNEVIDRWKPFLEKAKSSGQTVNTGEYQITCRDGSVRVCELYASFLEDNLIVTFNDITERNKAEEVRIGQLEQAAENMCIFIKHAPNCIAMLDCSMNYLAVSDHWIAYYGRGYSDLVGCNHYVIHPDIPEEWKTVHQQCLAGATLKNDEDCWEQSDGNRHWLSWAVLPWHYPDGKIGGIIMSAEDITERKLAEQALRESQERFMLMVNAMPQLGWIARSYGYITWYNERWYDYTGTTPEQMDGWGWQIVHDKVELPKVLDRWESSIATGKPFEMTFPLRGADGNFRQFLSRGFPLKNADGQVVQWFGTNTDVEEQTLTEKLLRESEARYRSLVEQAADGIFLADSQGRYIDVNREGCNMLGYSREEVLNLTLADVLDPAEIPRLGAAVLSLADGELVVSEWQFLRKNGSTFLGEVRGRQLANGNLQGILIDITARKQAENKLQMNEANLLAILNNSPYLSWLKDFEGRYIKVNKVFADFLRLERPEQAEGKTDLDLQPKELAEKYRADDVVVMAARKQKHVEESAFDGNRTHWVETYKTPVIDVHGNVIGTVGFASDITKRKLVEQELRVAAVTFETHDAILITDRHANIIRVNQAFTDITGYSSEEVLGKNPRMMSSGRQDRAFYREMWQQLLHTGSWAGEIWDKRKNGQVYPKWLTISVVKDETQETTHYVAIFSDITARKQADEEIRNLAFYDALTRLPNRRLFMDRFRAALTTSTRRNDYGAVLFIDLDRFKTLNDTLGHDYGDMLLIEVAARISSCVREMDTVARLGGDEFVVLIEGVGNDRDEVAHKVGLLAEKIRGVLAHPYRLKSHEHHSSPSIGVSLYLGNENTVDELIQHADMAMYQAKSAGRNAVRFFDPVMQQNVAMRAEMENDLYHAIALSQLRLHYQVQVDSKYQPLGAEALLRWYHPQRGMIMPGQFIPVAEDSTLILDIGSWVLDQACRQLALWRENKIMRDLTLAVNVSAKQFSQPNFADQIAGVVNLHQINPANLKLELTESLVLHDLNNAITQMHLLKKLGVKLSMDDFGTGYSSLSYLKQLPLDQIKIDHSFIHGITQDGNDALLVQTIIDMAGNFNMDVIAEGVETDAQLTFLKHQDCMSYQGFLFSKPLPLEDFEALLVKRLTGDFGDLKFCSLHHN